MTNMIIDKKKFRTPTSNILKTTTLFLEPKYELHAEPIYTIDMQDKDYKGVIYPSLYRLYMEMSDVTEYTFSNTYFESYQHWTMACEKEILKDRVKAWREELELKIRSEALKEILEQLKSEDPKKRLEAAKYLHDKFFIKATKGVPKKDRIVKEESKDFKLVKDHYDILQTIIN